MNSSCRPFTALIVLLNASQRVQKGRPKNFIPDTDIRPLAAAFLKGEPVEGEIAIVSRQQAQKADCNLSPSRWVGQTATGEYGAVGNIASRLEQLSREQIELDAKLIALLKPLIKETVIDAAE